MIQSTQSIHSTRQSFAAFRANEQMRHREIAKQLEMSEGELIAAFLGIDTPPLVVGAMQAVRLLPKWAEIMASIEPLGEVMARLTYVFSIALGNMDLRFAI